MALKKWSDERATDYGMNGNSAKFLTLTGVNTIRQLIDRAGVWSAGQVEGWGDAYIDADGRENSVTTTKSSATFDTNKYKITTMPTIYVEITATNLNPSDFAINNCLAIPHIDGDKWLIYCTSGTDAVKRAQIMKTLFYGTNGTDARIKTTYVTGITALKTNSSADVNKRAWYANLTNTSKTAATYTYTGTFADTTTNTNVNSWSYVTSTGSGTTTWEVPVATVLNTSSGTSDETGTDTTAEDKSNPANCVLKHVITGGTQNGEMRAFLLCKGSISWSAGGSPTSTSNIDFYTTHNVPLITDGSALDLSGYKGGIYHVIPANTFSATPSKAILVPLIVDWESGADIQFKLKNATEDTGWLNCSNNPTISSFTQFTSTPTILKIKLIPKSSSPSAGYPSIKGVWIYCD